MTEDLDRSVALETYLLLLTTGHDGADDWDWFWCKMGSRMNGMYYPHNLTTDDVGESAVRHIRMMFDQRHKGHPCNLTAAAVSESAAREFRNPSDIRSTIQ